MKKKTASYVSLSILDDIFDANNHPEAVSYKKVSDEIKKEFVSYWNKEREDDIITKNNFILYFEDVSFSVKNDDDFVKILSAFGFNS